MERDGTVRIRDTNLDGTPYTVVGGVDCDPIGFERSLAVVDYILDPGDALNFAANTLRSISVRALGGTVDVNGVTLPADAIYEVSEPDRITNDLAIAYNIDNVTTQAHVVTTAYN